MATQPRSVSEGRAAVMKQITRDGGGGGVGGLEEEEGNPMADVMGFFNAEKQQNM